MQAWWVLLCVALLLHTSSAEKPSSLKESTIVLNSTTFSKAISSGKWLVDFYAPWCGHCKHLAPIFEETAKHFKRDSWKRIKIAKVDCDDNGALCSREGVQGYPTIKYYQSGIGREYRALRTKEGFIEYVTTMERPVVTNVTSEELRNQIKKENHVAFVFLSEQGNKLSKDAEQYEAAAASFFDFDTPPCYVAAIDETSSSAFGSRGGLFAIRDTDVISYNGVYDVENIKAWMTKNQHPYLVKLTEFNFEPLSKQPILIGVYHPEQKEAVAKKFISNMRSLARRTARNADAIQFAVLDASKFERFVANYEISALTEPALFQLHLEDEVHYIDHNAKYDTEESIQNFLNKIKSGDIKWQTWSSSAYYSALARKYTTKLGLFLYEYLYFVVGGLLALIVYLVYTIYQAIQADVEHAKRTSTKRE